MDSCIKQVIIMQDCWLFFSVDHENFLLLGVHGSSKMRTSSKDILVKRGSIALQILVHIYLAGTSVILFMLFMVLCCKKL